MSVTTIHKYLNAYPIQPDAKYLIIGTIHPHRTETFKMDFFYGNKNSLWSILADAFPGKDFSNKEQIVKTLNAHKTTISDMILKCDRPNTGTTQDKELFNIHLNTEAIRKGIINSDISTIFLTSRFGKNSATHLFTDSFKIRYKDSWNKKNSSFRIPKAVFGRTIKAIVLYSPSGQANTGIAKSAAYQEKRHLYKNLKTPVKQFRIDFYREKFRYFNK